VSWGAGSADTASKIGEIAKKGALGIIVQRSQVEKVRGASPDIPVLVVENTRRALRQLASAARQRFGGKQGSPGCFGNRGLQEASVAGDGLARMAQDGSVGNQPAHPAPSKQWLS